MLTELYQYAMDKNLSDKPGFKKKKVKAYVLLSAAGEFLGINVSGKNAEPVYAPDIGSAAQGKLFCNPLIEKAKYPLGPAGSVKRDDYLLALKDGSAAEPLLGVLLAALENEDTVKQITDSMEKHKLKGEDVIGFQIDGKSPEQSAKFIDWWSDYRKRYDQKTKKEQLTLPRCMITGEPASAMRTVPKVPGLWSVGGHSSGDAFLCFDKDAFQSFGLKQSANAPVSEPAITAVNAALTELIMKAPPLSGSKIVHWYSGEIPADNDPVEWMLDPNLMPEWDEEEDVEENDSGEREHAAILDSNELLTAVNQGHEVDILHSRYYIMPLSGVNGRMMIRGWYEGNFQELQQNVKLWFEDLRLTTWNGKGMAKDPKLVTLYIRLLKPGGDKRKVFDRVNQELSGLSVRMLYCIIQGLPLPDEIPIRVTHWICSGMLKEEKDGDESTGKNDIAYEMPAFQLLKAWLRRDQRKKGEHNLMEAEENKNVCRDASYYCGQLMAVYAAIQSCAMPDVNVGLAQRYYTAASTNPAFVIGRLSQLSQHHLAKLSEKQTIYYQKILGEIYQKIGEQEIPAALTARQQSEFALGYYQKRAQLYSSSGKKANTDGIETGADNITDTNEEV